MNNNFSWSYIGNVTDSIKENVKRAGGNVSGVLRFSIQWNDNPNQPNQNDFDAHCIEPKASGKFNHIFYPQARRKFDSSGMLDVDIINPGREVAIENIVWTNKEKMPTGIYEMKVQCYADNGGIGGFQAEIEFDGKIYPFSYRKKVRQSEFIEVAKVKFSKEKGFEIIESLPIESSSKNIWNIQTEKFQPVSSIMYSPNYWGTSNIGNKHIFFMLKNCKNHESITGIYNEFLHNDLNKHRKVFEMLGSMMKVPKSDEQLSGLGFSLTKRNYLVAKVKGNFNRTLKIIF